MNHSVPARPSRPSRAVLLSALSAGAYGYLSLNSLKPFGLLPQLQSQGRSGFVAALIAVLCLVGLCFSPLQRRDQIPPLVWFLLGNAALLSVLLFGPF